MSAILALIAKKAGGAILDRVRDNRSTPRYTPPPPPPPPKKSILPVVLTAATLAAAAYFIFNDD